MTQLLNDFLSGSAAWGVLLTLAAFALGTLINRVTGKAIFNPLLLGSIFVIIFLSVCSIPYADYKDDRCKYSIFLHSTLLYVENTTQLVIFPRQSRTLPLIPGTRSLFLQQSSRRDNRILPVLRMTARCRDPACPSLW